MTWHTPDAEQEDRPPMRIWSRSELDQRVRQSRKAEASLNALLRHREGRAGDPNRREHRKVKKP